MFSADNSSIIRFDYEFIIHKVSHLIRKCAELGFFDMILTMNGYDTSQRRYIMDRLDKVGYKMFKGIDKRGVIFIYINWMNDQLSDEELWRHYRECTISYSLSRQI